MNLTEAISAIQQALGVPAHIEGDTIVLHLNDESARRLVEQYPPLAEYEVEP